MATIVSRACFRDADTDNNIAIRDYTTFAARDADIAAFMRYDEGEGYVVVCALVDGRWVEDFRITAANKHLVGA